jgi:hypothetical protein
MKKTVSGLKKTRRVKVKEEDYSNVDPKEVILNFGMHKGKALRDVPNQYLEWLISNVKDRPALVEAVKRFFRIYSNPVSKLSQLRTKRVISLAGLQPRNTESLPPPLNIFQECSRLVKLIYSNSPEVDVTQLSTVEFIRYRFWMDTARKMQAVVDKDAGKNSPHARAVLWTLRASLDKAAAAGNRE